MKKTISEEAKEIMTKSAKLTAKGKAAVKAPPARKSVTKIGEPVIVRPEEVREAEAKKAAAKVVKAPARKKSVLELKPDDYTTVIKDGLAVAVPKESCKTIVLNGVNVAVPLSDTRSGDPVLSEEDKKRYRECVKTFRSAWESSQKTMLKAAFILYEIDTDGLYRIDGYKNITEFGESVFGLSKSTTYNLIEIVRRFGKKITNGKPVLEIADQYSGYSKSQLGVMVGHTDDELAAITPEMSVREIKAALKKSKPVDEPKKPENRDEKGKSGFDDQTPSESVFRANLIHEFSTVAEWDAMRNPADELAFAQLCNTIRYCLNKGHSVRIMDCFTVEREQQK